MLITIVSLTVKQPTEKISGYTLKLKGGYTENILPEGKDSASDPRKSGTVTLQIENGESWGFQCKMKAAYKVAEAGGTDVTWTCRPDEALDDDRVARLNNDIRLEGRYIATFVEGK